MGLFVGEASIRVINGKSESSSGSLAKLLGEVDNAGKTTLPFFLSRVDKASHDRDNKPLERVARNEFESVSIFCEDPDKFWLV